MDYTHFQSRKVTRVKGGKTSILHVVDHFTKFGMVRAVEHETAEEVIGFLRLLFEEVGVPEAILSDNGSHFTDKVT